jgi:hypothetical protein
MIKSLFYGGVIIKVKFKDKTLDIKNESESKKEFVAHWNGYTIEVSPYETHISSNGLSRKLKYEAYCVNPLGFWICDSTTHDKISEGVQECFNNIETDIDDLKSTYDEIGEWLKLVKDYI